MDVQSIFSKVVVMWSAISLYYFKQCDQHSTFIEHRSLFKHSSKFYIQNFTLIRPNSSTICVNQCQGLALLKYSHQLNSFVKLKFHIYEIPHLQGHLYPFIRNVLAKTQIGGQKFTLLMFAISFTRLVAMPSFSISLMFCPKSLEEIDITQF